MAFRPLWYAPLAGRTAGPQPAGAVVLAVMNKSLVHCPLLTQLGNGPLAGALPSVVSGRSHVQHMAKLAHEHMSSALGDVAAGTD